MHAIDIQNPSGKGETNQCARKHRRMYHKPKRENCSHYFEPTFSFLSFRQNAEKERRKRGERESTPLSFSLFSSQCNEWWCGNARHVPKIN